MIFNSIISKIKSKFYNLYKNIYSFFWVGSFEGNPYLKISNLMEGKKIYTGMSRKELRELASKPTTIEQNAMGMPILKFMQSYQGYTEWWALTFDFNNKLLFYEYENDQILPEDLYTFNRWSNPTKRFPF